MTRLVTLGELDRHWSGRWNLGQAMVLPVPTIHVHHTVTADTGDPIADGAKVHDIDQGRFGKISYSWLVHESSGSWVEGETVHRGAHTINNANQSLNGISFGVGVIGNFHPAAPIPPPRPASDALVELIAAGIREFIVDPGLVSAGFAIDGHRDVYATACCGDNLYDRLPVIRTFVSSPPAPPSEEDTMKDQSGRDSTGRIWTFHVRANGTLCARVIKAGGVGFDSPVLELGGTWLSIDPPIFGANGIVDLYGRGTDNNRYGLHDDGTSWGSPYLIAA